jgi:hypothetical protein
MVAAASLRFALAMCRGCLHAARWVFRYRLVSVCALLRFLFALYRRAYSALCPCAAPLKVPLARLAPCLPTLAGDERLGVRAGMFDDVGVRASDISALYPHATKERLVHCCTVFYRVRSHRYCRVLRNTALPRRFRCLVRGF